MELISLVEKLGIYFEPPKNGWLIIDLTSGSQHCRFSPSYLPHDSIYELITALCNILEYSGRSVVHWNTEPIEYDFVFEAKGDQITLQVILIKSGHETISKEPVFTYKGNTYEVIRSFWKTLQELVSRQSVDEYENHWRWPFPVEELKKLTRRVQELKKGS
jgi:hypothetical protein